MVGTQTSTALPLPVIGHPEIFYVRQIAAAEQAGNIHAREGAKIGRYVTLALDPSLAWAEKFRYFRHAMKHHTTAPLGADADVIAYYGKLCDMVKRYASQEAMRQIRKHHDELRGRAQKGEPRDALLNDARNVFASVLGAETGCPSWMRGDTWQQVQVLQKQWV